MEKEISISELEKISEKYNIRIWISEKFGKRWSYITGSGEERFLPARLIGEIKNYGIFVEGELFDREAVMKDVSHLFS